MDSRRAKPGGRTQPPGGGDLSGCWRNKGGEALYLSEKGVQIER